MQVIGNVLQILARVKNSSLHIDKMLLSRNIFTCTLCPIETSNLKVYGAEFHTNKVESLIHMDENVLNKIYENGYPIAKSMILSKNVVLTKNNVTKEMLYLTFGSTATIQNNTLIESNVSKAVSNSFGMIKIQLNNVVFI